MHRIIKGFTCVFTQRVKCLDDQDQYWTGSDMILFNRTASQTADPGVTNVGKKVSGKKVSGKKVSEKKIPEKKYQEKK